VRKPVHVTRSEDECNLLHGHREAVYAWAGAGVALILGGHIYLSYVRPLRERFNDLPRPVWVVQAGTAVSSRVRDGAPNFVNVIYYTHAEQRDNVSSNGGTMMRLLRALPWSTRTLLASQGVAIGNEIA